MTSLLRLVFWVLVLAGVSRIVTHGRIFLPLRRLATLGRPQGTEASRFLSCPLCVGFWIGVVLFEAGFALLETSSHDLLSRFLLPFLHGSAASCVAIVFQEVSEILQQVAYAVGQFGLSLDTPPPADSPSSPPPSSSSSQGAP
jgi:hypothetical protein